MTTPLTHSAPSDAPISSIPFIPQPPYLEALSGNPFNPFPKHESVSGPREQPSVVPAAELHSIAPNAPYSLLRLPVP